MHEQDFIFYFEWEPSDIISSFLLGILFFWGVFLAYKRWIRRYEIPYWLDLLSLILMFIILGIELVQLRDWLRNFPLLYILTGLGLFIFASALYSQSLISILTTVFMSVIHPGEESAPDIPRFGPAEILERQGDWKGALNEYYILARIYPHHPSVHLRIANAYVKLNQPEEALLWLKKSLKYLKREEDLYLIVARFCDIAHDIQDVKSYYEMIDYFSKLYPDSPHTQSILERKKRIKTDTIKEKSSLLISMEELPINNSETEEKSQKTTEIVLEKIEDNTIGENPLEIVPSENIQPGKSNSKPPLSPLEPM